VANAALAYVRQPELLVEGNRVELLRRGEQAYPAMLAAIASATSHVHLETYILRSDKTGLLFQAAMIERARAGVRVRLLYDAGGSLNLISDEYLTQLADAGIEIVEFHPITPWRRKWLLRLRGSRDRKAELRGLPAPRHGGTEPAHWSINRRDHQKILVVDDRVAFTGGLNIGDEYAPAPEGGDWHDLHARVEGPAVLGLARIFWRSWILGEGEPFDPPHSPKLATAELRPMLAHTCENFGLRERSRMNQAYRHAIRNARAAISITNAYFIPTRRLGTTLRNAARRGVDVRVIVPANSDVKLVGYASRYLYSRLLRAGVRIFEYPERMMHAKAGVIDGTWATIGSFNLDRRSVIHNLEAGLVILDCDFAAALERQFAADVAICREVVLAEWNKRPYTQRLLEWFAHLFAYWL
jgi:cardiolipin synthase